MSDIVRPGLSPAAQRGWSGADASSADVISPDRLVAAHEAAVAFYRQQLNHADGPRRYLIGRGLGVVVDRDRPWQVGYAPPGWTVLRNHLTRLGFTPQELRVAGLTVTARTGRDVDRFRDRIVFPIRDTAGDTVAFIGRAPDCAAPETPKYLNSPESPIYTKGKLLFGVAEQAERIAAGWAPALVEGPADVLAVWLSYSRGVGTGVMALAPCGTALTETQASAIVAYPGAGAHGILVAFDGDEAGQRAADRAYDLLRGRDVALHGVRFVPGTDPADLLYATNGYAMLRSALERGSRPLVDVVIDHRIDRLAARHPRVLADPSGRVTAVRAVAPLIVDLCASEAVRLVSHVAERTGACLEAVTAAVIDAVEHTPSPRRLSAWSAAEPTRRVRPIAVAFPPRPVLDAAASTGTSRNPTSRGSLSPSGSRQSIR